MTTKPKVAPATPKARSRRKTKPVQTAKVIQLTPELIAARSRKQEPSISHGDTSQFTEAELEVSRKHKSGADIMALLKEAYALMSEPQPKCNVIPFPASRTRKSKSAKGAQ